MRYLFGFLCVCALGVMPLISCTEAAGDGGLCEGAACDDGNECTEDVCDPADGSCSNLNLADGSFCDAGYCQSGQCEPITSVFPCDEQGILDAIEAGGGPHGFDCNVPTVVTTMAEIVIDNDVILDGRDNLTVDGNDEHPVLFVPIGVAAELRRFTVTGGFSAPLTFTGVGSGISNEGILKMINCSVTRNYAEDLGAGGIGNSGTLTLTNSSVSENTADFFGAIWNLGALDLTDSTVSRNAAAHEPLGVNGVMNDFGATLSVTNSTVSENAGGEYGGILNNGGTLTLTNSTVSGNSGEESGGIFNGHGTLAIANSTVSGNTAASGASIVNVINLPGGGSALLTIASSLVDGDCAGFPQGAPDITSNGYNIESPGKTCGFNQEGDQAGVTTALLDLQPLANNGGPTQTHAIMTDSAAFNAGTCEVDTDQRGVDRPQGTMCDVGAFELEQP